MAPGILPRRLCFASENALAQVDAAIMHSGHFLFIYWRLMLTILLLSPAIGGGVCAAFVKFARAGVGDEVQRAYRPAPAEFCLPGGLCAVMGG
jgi:hypothetical protein